MTGTLLNTEAIMARLRQSLTNGEDRTQTEKNQIIIGKCFECYNKETGHYERTEGELD